VNEELGQIVSQFVAKRIDTPHPEEVEVWIQLVYADLFSSGFVAWLPAAKACSSGEETKTQLNRLISEIAKDAEIWIRDKIKEVLRIRHSNIRVNSVDEIRFYLGAMFSEAIAGMTERKFEPETARSHACFVHLSENLRRLALTGKAAIDVQHVLKQGIAGTDAMAKGIQDALKPKSY
jgi:hypothetical protein